MRSGTAVPVFRSRRALNGKVPWIISRFFPPRNTLSHTVFGSPAVGMSQIRKLLHLEEL